MTFVPTNNRLQLHPKSVAEEDLNNCETYARRILELLVHTPVKAIGENFVFRSVDPPPPVLEDFPVLQDLAEKFGFDFTIRDREIGLSLELGEGRVVNLERWLKNNGSVEFRFNFHYDVTSATQAREVLENSFFGNCNRARSIVEAYGFVIEEQGGEQNG